MTNYKSIAFDLDDTLLDTSGILVPDAARRACEALRESGVNCSLSECLEIRHTMATNHSHQEIFSFINDKFGTKQNQTPVERALEKFYNPEVPDSLPLLPGSIENLEQLKKKYSLFLVTMGSLDSQTKKIKSLKIEHHFQKIYILNNFAGEKKESAFRNILELKGHAPEKLLSIGNRLSSEIRDAKRLGAQTCYFAYGEHVGEIPQYPEDHPDFTIFHHRDLINTCGL